jgi:ABC-type nitrate/sulfonate/bicarbonate transport system ATPase subunit
MTATKIRIESVSKCYNSEVAALERVDLALAENSLTCLLGPSGCGKSTLLNMIAGFVEPTEGRVLVDGVEVVGASADRGVVFQEYALFPWRTALDNVAFGPMIRRLPRAERRAQARRYLALVGLTEHGEKFPSELSGGMKQRVAIARALANEPLVVLADEPTGNLDSAATLEVLRLFDSLHEAGQTLVVVTHDTRIAATADRMISMRDGAFVEETRLTGGTSGHLAALAGLDG